MEIAKLYNVTDRVVIVTGGASGLGLAIAEAFVVNKARVTILDADPNALATALQRLGPNATGEVLNITDRAATDNLFDAVAQRWGRIDVVFANAGISGGGGFADPAGGENPAGTIDGCPDAEWDKVLEIDLTGTKNTLAAAARVMKAQGGGGKIILTSSGAAIRNISFVSTAYHVAKAGASHLGRQLALELAPYNIRVNMIAPVSFVTNIGNGGMKLEAVRDLFARQSPLHRVAQPEEIVGAALFLGSDASSWVTGAELVVDGGCTLAGRE